MIHAIKKIIKHVFNQFYPDKHTRKFINHNKKIWDKFPDNETKSEVLFEVKRMEPNIIAYSYFANVLAKKYNAKIKSYYFGRPKPFGMDVKRIYHSFNADVFKYKLDKEQREEQKRLFKEIYDSLTSKHDVFNLIISDIWIGDLLTDYHLRKYKIPTTDIKKRRFKRSLKEALYHFIFWRDYFNEHNVKAINVSHCAYLIAIPLRIAIKNGVPAYQINANGCYHMSENRLWAYNDFYDYPKQFAELSENQKKEGLQIAKERIERRFKGEVGVDMPYSTKSAYTNERIARVLSENNKFKVLIAAHCFFDSPNGIGPNLFPDFYEWLTFLGAISLKTDYEWYIKTHPDYLPGNIPVLKSLIKKYPKFTLIPSETSHHQIIDEGIGCVLTVYGTIGFEYAALGKLVVNASLSNPHVAYNFNLHPKSIDEYKKILLTLPDQDISIDINEVYEYYSMKLKRSDMRNWLLKNYNSYVKELGSYKSQFTTGVYFKFIDEFTQHRHSSAIRILNNFIESNDYCMRWIHDKYKNKTAN